MPEPSSIPQCDLSAVEEVLAARAMLKEVLEAETWQSDVALYVEDHGYGGLRAMERVATATGVPLTRSVGYVEIELHESLATWEEDEGVRPEIRRDDIVDTLSSWASSRAIRAAHQLLDCLDPAQRESSAIKALAHHIDLRKK